MLATHILRCHDFVDHGNLLVKPLGGMALVALDGAVVGVHACELDVFAEVVAALCAEEALAAGHARLDGDAVTGLEVLDALAAADNHAGGLVADDAVAFEDESADLARLPEVDVGSGGREVVSALFVMTGVSKVSREADSPANTSRLDVDQDLALLGRQDGGFLCLEAVVGRDHQ